MSDSIFVCAEHGLAVVYFLQSDVVSDLIAAGYDVVLLTDDDLTEKITERFGQSGLIPEGMRLGKVRQYLNTYKPRVQYWLDYLRRAGASSKINLGAVESYIEQVETEAGPRRRQFIKLINFYVFLMRHFKLFRKIVVRAQRRFNPELYTDLFEKYQPKLVISSTPGWRFDRYLLRESAARGVNTASIILGWDNSSSYSLPGADMDWATCWSEIQKEEMVDGSDWAPEQVSIGGIPTYDGYIEGRWLVGKEAYFQQHNLDPDRKLIAYANSFNTLSPNVQNVVALVKLVSEEQLNTPSQLLIRLHPNHFLDVPRFIGEREMIYQLAAEHEHIHVVEPVSLGGSLGHYSGEDMPEKASMMAYADVFVTVYSTMAVETSVVGKPVVALCIDSETGWPGKYYLPLSQISHWPTHDRFRKSNSGKVALNINELRQHLNFYLENPEADLDARKKFVRDEITYTDGSAGKKTAENILKMIEKGGYR
jgi:hypothetical protein